MSFDKIVKRSRVRNTVLAAITLDKSQRDNLESLFFLILIDTVTQTLHIVIFEAIQRCQRPFFDQGLRQEEILPGFRREPDHDVCRYLDVGMDLQEGPDAVHHSSDGIIPVHGLEDRIGSGLDRYGQCPCNVLDIEQFHIHLVVLDEILRMNRTEGNRDIRPFIQHLSN